MAKEKTVQVRAKVAHTEPGTQIYRQAGDVFVHTGELYKHVEKVAERQPAEPQGEEETDAGQG